MTYQLIVQDPPEPAREETLPSKYRFTLCLLVKFLLRAVQE